MERGGRGRGSEGVETPGVAGGVNAGLMRDGGGCCEGRRAFGGVLVASDWEAVVPART